MLRVFKLYIYYFYSAIKFLDRHQSILLTRGKPFNLIMRPSIYLFVKWKLSQQIGSVVRQIPSIFHIYIIPLMRPFYARIIVHPLRINNF
ncbi:hypothetical protein A0257_22290 [Hymenobacter psoromatis]|nr:hypothetical protein A0257_22290 [Hymenobacter psoromatis]